MAEPRDWFVLQHRPGPSLGVGELVAGVLAVVVRPWRVLMAR